MVKVKVISTAGSILYYDISERLQRLGLISARSFDTRITFNFGEESITANTARVDWQELFEKQLRCVIKSRVSERSSAREHIQEILSLAASIFEYVQQRQSAAKSTPGSRENNDSAPLIKTIEPLNKERLPSEVLRMHSGRVLTKGIVSSSTGVYHLIKNAMWRCVSCGNTETKKMKTNFLPQPQRPRKCRHCKSQDGFDDEHEYINAMTLYLQDNDDNTGNSSDNSEESTIDTLTVIVLGKDTDYNYIGECVKFIGVIQEIEDRKTGRFHSYLVARAVLLEQRKKQELSARDIAAIKKFAGLEPIWGGKACLLNTTVIDRQVSMFAPNVIGDKDKKLALLLSAVGAPGSYRGRINVLMIGPPATAKTKLAKQGLKLRPNSRFVSGKNTTGLSLTAMILPENDSYVVHLGPVPLSKNAICAINEFDKLDPSQQDNLLDVMEEGIIPLNKYARLRNIRSPTTIMATANPRNNRWLNPGGYISGDEIPIEQTKLSRFDVILIFDDTKDVEENRKYAKEKTEYDRKEIKHSSVFLQKYIEYARRINPVLTPEAESVLSEYWVQLRAKDGLFVTRRLLETLYRLAKALARLHLKKVADVDIAEQVIILMNNTMIRVLAAVCKISEPRSLAYNETLNLIRQLKGTPIDLIEAIKMVCHKNRQVAYYLGAPIEQSQNKKVRHLCNIIIEHKSILRTNVRPVVVRWNQEDGNEALAVQSNSDGKGGVAMITSVSSTATTATIVSSPSEPGSHRSHESQDIQDNQSAITSSGCDLYDQYDHKSGGAEESGKNSKTTAISFRNFSSNSGFVSKQLQVPSEIKRILPDCISFDSEWDPVSHAISAAAFVDTYGSRKVLQLSDYRGSEAQLVQAYVNELMKHQASVGWGTIGARAACSNSIIAPIGNSGQPDTDITGGA